MRTLNFPEKDVVLLSEEQVETLNNYKNTSSAKNGLVNAIIIAYNEHNILTISPDDVMNNICCLWAKYICLNAERFRGQIVTHNGKKKLTILTIQNITWDDDLLIEHMDRYISSINEDHSALKWMDISFSTTTKLDKMIRQVSMLSSQKEYYAYHSRTMCWLPKINLLGTEEDWENLYNKVKWMPCYDQDMIDWKAKLLTVLDKFIIASEEHVDFWQAPLTRKSGGSGIVPTYCGWVTVFNPFDEKGKWGSGSLRGLGYDIETTPYYHIPTEEILNLTVDFEIVCEDDYGIQHGSVKVFAGPTSVGASVEDGICPKNKLYFNYSAK